MHTPSAVALTRAGRSLVDVYLDEQSCLTAVDRFAQQHEQGGHRQGRYYKDLIPLSRPQLGQQYGFEVDLDSCSGCKACVTACHNLNGLEEHETWRSVGLLIGGAAEQPYQQHVSTACHHCLEPACLEGCPVNAYEKDPVTGIVKHLDDQCIGCQYCILKCPYEVPQYSKSKGIVRKCDMCSSRLEVGEAPACVQGCPNQAIRIVLIDRKQVVEDSETDTFLPGAPSPQVTLPTTQFKSQRAMPRNTVPADYHTLLPQHAHPALVIMLVLTQLSVGAFAVSWALDALYGATSLAMIQSLYAATALGMGMLALGASTCHLGRPRYAFRAVVGLRTSWLSREILGFSLFAALAGVDAFLAWRAGQRGASGNVVWLRGLVVGSGAVSIFCSAMIYHSTQRANWRVGPTLVKFTLSALLLGLATALGTAVLAASFLRALSIVEIMDICGRRLCACLSVISLAKIAYEALILRHLLARTITPLQRTARLLVGPLRSATATRLLAGLVGGVALPILLMLAQLEGPRSTMPAWVALVLVLLVWALTMVGEAAERYLFFASVATPRMPGAPLP